MSNPMSLGPDSTVEDVAAAGRWYVVQTGARAERLAAQRLRSTGFAVHYPHFPGTVRHARRVIGVLKPLFPRYLFVAVHIDRALYDIERRTIGVAAVVRCGAAALEVPPAVIAAELRRCDGDGKLSHEEMIRLSLRPRERGERNHGHRIGDRVRFTGGPLTDFVGIVAQLDKTDTLRVWVQTLGRRVSVRAKSGDVAAAG